jgi:hypothetical protein
MDGRRDATEQRERGSIFLDDEVEKLLQRRKASNTLGRQTEVRRGKRRR